MNFEDLLVVLHFLLFTAEKLNESLGSLQAVRVPLSQLGGEHLSRKKSQGCTWSGERPWNLVEEGRCSQRTEKSGNIIPPGDIPAKTYRFNSSSLV